ncbi:AAA family ATPase [Pedobacter sp. UBA5917]|jgi:HTH-type transcriptional repressor of NAD biosynthesis genes|uniref:AAA family ATPase n=1 Tax=Pedobacter sp. UBA5917 TaxID=1947061 RepID=UPI0025D784F9|nr:AAA family ATPase [Pedobacter sp. UBA5917]
MKRGLVIGKFMPIHKGHIALINFAAAHCDELIVSMSFTPDDKIDPVLRFGWIMEIFKDQPNIKPAIIADNFDDETLTLKERTAIWANRMREVYPKIDILFSSEFYGAPFALHLQAEHILFDEARKFTPVSATLIRNNPFQYWDFIPEIVRPYFVKKICFYGPESTGKSTMAEKMAKHYNTTFVPEVARELITSNDITTKDIINIGIAQTARVKEKTSIANKIVFCDTDLITTKIYSQYYLNEVPEILNNLENEIKYDLYFLMNIDVEWVADHLRDFGDRRLEMFNLFKSELEKRGINYILISGNYEEREENVKKYITSILI